MKANSILRQQARENLGGKIFASNWLWMVLAGIIISAANSVAASVTMAFGAIGVIVIAGAVQYGLARTTVNLARGAEKPNLLDLTKGFTEGFGRTFLLGLMTNLFVALWSLLFLIPGIIKSYSYAMAPFIMQDDPSKGWNECITESRQMMNGHKAQLFWLDFSFIGWIIVGALTCGIGMLFVTPYMNQARANFYLELKAQQHA
jgi:uncharacterized membrane protein